MATCQGLPRPLCVPAVGAVPPAEGVACPERPPSFPLPSGSSALTARPGEACAEPGIPLALAFSLARGLGAQGGPGCRLRAASLRVWSGRTQVSTASCLCTQDGGGVCGSETPGGVWDTGAPPPPKAQGQSDDGIPRRRVAGPRRLTCGPVCCETPVAPLSSRPPCLPALSGLGWGPVQEAPPVKGVLLPMGCKLDWVGRSSASQRTTEELGQGGGETRGQFSALASVPRV